MACTTRFDTPGTSSCPKDWPVISLIQNMDQIVTVQIVDNDGAPATTLPSGLPQSSSSLDTVTTSSSSQTITIIADDVDNASSGVELWFKEHRTATAITKIVGALQSDGSTFVFNIPADKAYKPGLYLGDILMANELGAIVYVKHVYIEIDQNLTDQTFMDGPLTIAEIRLALRDSCPEDNYLLDSVEFSNREIVYAIKRPIDFFNNQPPNLGNFTYTNFPYRWWWTEATIAHLLQIAAANLRRNALPSSAGGLQVDDKGPKANIYEQIAMQKLQSYAQWVDAKKIELNIDGGYSYVSGEWV